MSDPIYERGNPDPVGWVVPRGEVWAAARADAEKYAHSREWGSGVREMPWPGEMPWPDDLQPDEVVTEVRAMQRRVEQAIQRRVEQRVVTEGRAMQRRVEQHVVATSLAGRRVPAGPSWGYRLRRRCWPAGAWRRYLAKYAMSLEMA